jgi:hypothetical protein
MYSMIIFSSTAPTVVQKYPRAHRCCPQYRFRRCGKSSCNRRDDFLFTYCTSFAGDNSGGADTSRWMWSGRLFGEDKTVAAGFSMVYFLALTVPPWILGALAISRTGMNLSTIRSEAAALQACIRNKPPKLA